MNGSTPNPDKSIGTLIKGLAEDLSTLVRSEIALAKLELKQSVVQLVGGSAALIAAVFCLLFALAFFFVTAVLGLVQLGVPAWLSTLIVALILLIAAVVLALMGKKKFASLSLMPTETMKNVQNDIAVIKSDITRARQRTT